MKKIALLTLVLASLLSIQAAGVAQGDGSSAQTSATKSVSIRGFAYRPATLTVAKRTTVRFSNRDGAPHTATRTGGGFDTGRIGAGKSASVRFNRAGTFRYHCTIHPSMRGKIVVK